MGFCRPQLSFLSFHPDFHNSTEDVSNATGVKESTMSKGELILIPMGLLFWKGRWMLSM